MINSVPAAAPRYREFPDEDSRQGFDALRERAEQGDTNSMLARLYRNGRGVPLDFAKAEQYLKMARAHGAQPTPQVINSIWKANHPFLSLFF
jgi:TPR repeat protein